jgi:chromosome partitioning protein
MKLAGLEAARGGLADMDNPQNRLALVIDRITRAKQDPATPPPVPPPDAPPTEPLVVSAPEPKRRYDAVIIDCPPSIGLLSYNALAAATEVVIPVETSFFSLRGAGKQIQTARSVVRHVGSAPRIRLLATMYDPALPLARDLLDDLRDRFGAAVIPSVIRLDPEVKESTSFGRPIEEHSPDSFGAQDYGSLCEWLIEHAEIERPEPEDARREQDPTTDIPHDLPDNATDEATGDARPRPLPEPTLSAPPGLSRAQEMALKAATMVAARPTTPTRRSVMPQRAVAIELIDDAESEAKRAAAATAKAHSIRHLWGCRPVTAGLLFVHPCAGVGSVAVAGSFNGWNPKAGQMTPRPELGIFEHRALTPPGRYEYRLVIDGVWQCDPYNPARVSNGLGDENNLAVVGQP